MVESLHNFIGSEYVRKTRLQKLQVVYKSALCMTVKLQWMSANKNISQPMRPESEMDEELPSPEGIADHSSNLTPPKSCFVDYADRDSGYPYYHEMMIVETPIKTQERDFDILLKSETQHEGFPVNQVLFAMEEEELKDVQSDNESLIEEMQDPDILQEILSTYNDLQHPVKESVQKDGNLSTFKTPGRSTKEVLTSTTNKKKSCTCRKSNCLKKYCQCLKAGEVCDQNCYCLGCKNNDHSIVRSKCESSTKEVPIMCNCKKSNCTKGYCDCHAAGKVCSQLCNCLDCKNSVPTPSQFALTHTSKRSKRKTVQWDDLMEE